MNGFEATKRDYRKREDAGEPGTRHPIWCALTATHVDDFERHELMKFNKETDPDVMESEPYKILRLFKVADLVSPMFSEGSTSEVVDLVSPMSS